MSRCAGEGEGQVLAGAVVRALLGRLHNRGVNGAEKWPRWGQSRKAARGEAYEGAFPVAIGLWAQHATTSPLNWFR